MAKWGAIENALLALDRAYSEYQKQGMGCGHLTLNDPYQPASPPAVEACMMRQWEIGTDWAS